MLSSKISSFQNHQRESPYITDDTLQSSPGSSDLRKGAISQREVESEFETLFRSETVRLAPDFRENTPKKTKIIDMSLNFPYSSSPRLEPTVHKYNDAYFNHFIILLILVLI